MEQSTFMWIFMGFIALMLVILILRTKKSTTVYQPPEVKADDGALSITQSPQTETEKEQVLKQTKRPFGAICYKAFISAWSKIKFYLQLRDAFWSFPLFFFLYYITGEFFWHLGWRDTGFYDPAFIQPIFLAGAALLGALGIWQFVLYFYFRTIHRYIWGKHKPDEKVIVNYSKDDFKNLTGWQRLKVSLFIFSVVLVFVLLVFIRMK